MARDRSNTEVAEPVGEAVEETTTDETAEKPAEKPVSKKHDLPEGFVTPVEFAKHAGKVRGEEIRPQIAYGWLKSDKSFAALVSQHTDGRNILNLEQGLEWFRSREERMATKKAEKEAKAAADAEKAKAAEETSETASE